MAKSGFQPREFASQAPAVTVSAHHHLQASHAPSFGQVPLCHLWACSRTWVTTHEHSPPSQHPPPPQAWAHTPTYTQAKQLETLGLPFLCTTLFLPLHPHQEAYTRVLIGNIDLSRLIFPAGTSGRFQRPGWTQSLRH